MDRYEVRLMGPEARGARISGSALRDLLDILDEGCRAAVRLRVEGRSKAGGRQPAWLTSAARFDFVELREGSTIVVLDARPLEEAAPEKFGQRDFWSELDVGRSALTLMDESLAEALAGRGKSDLYDSDLVGAFERFALLVGGGYRSVEISGRSPVTVGASELKRLSELRRATPAPRRVRLSGLLDAIRWSDCMFTLRLADGTELRGVAAGDGLGPQDLQRHFGQQVVVSSRVVFRPSGRPLRIEADSMEPAGPGAEIWSHIPKPLEGALDARSLVQPQGPRSGLSAVFGRWPGDEPDEDVRRALRQVS